MVFTVIEKQLFDVRHMSAYSITSKLKETLRDHKKHSLPQLRVLAARGRVPAASAAIERLSHCGQPPPLPLHSSATLALQFARQQLWHGPPVAKAPHLQPMHKSALQCAILYMHVCSAAFLRQPMAQPHGQVKRRVSRMVRRQQEMAVP